MTHPTNDFMMSFFMESGVFVPKTLPAQGRKKIFFNLKHFKQNIILGIY